MIWLKKLAGRDSPFFFCFSLVALAFIIRLLIANAQIIAPDGLFYVKIAKSVSIGDFQAVSNQGFFNLYPFFIALFQMVFHDWELSGKMVSVLFGSLAAVPFFLLVRGFCNTPVAVAATLFYIVHPRFVEYSSDVLREPTFWFFSITGLWIAQEGIARQRSFLFILSSLAIGLSVATRLEGAIFFFVIILWLLWIFITDKTQRGRVVTSLCVFLISLPIVMSPLLWVLKSHIHRWELGQPVAKIADLINADEEERRVESDVPRTASLRFKGFLDISERHRYFLFGIETIYKFIKSLNVVLFILFAWGLWTIRYRSGSKHDALIGIWLLAAFCALYIYVAKVHYLSTRHGLLMAMPALVWAGEGFRDMCSRIQRRVMFKETIESRFYVKTVALSIVLLILMSQTVTSFRSDKIELKKAGIVLKKMGYTGMTFLVQPNLNRIAFYADSESIFLPGDVDASIIKKLISEDGPAKLLIIDERSVSEYSFGAHSAIIAGGFQRVSIPQFQQYKEYTFAVYKSK